MYEDYSDRLLLIYVSSGYDYDLEKVRSLNLIAKNAYTYLCYLDTLINHKSSYIDEACTPIFFALQQSFYIECNKLFDKSGEDVKCRNIYNFIEHLDTMENDKYWTKCLSKFNNIIEAIGNRRNKYFAHNTSLDISKLSSAYKISSRNELVELLKFCIDITDFYSCSLPHKAGYCYSNYLHFKRLDEYFGNKEIKDDN